MSAARIIGPAECDQRRFASGITPPSLSYARVRLCVAAAVMVGMALGSFAGFALHALVTA